MSSCTFILHVPDRFAELRILHISHPHIKATLEPQQKVEKLHIPVSGGFIHDFTVCYLAPGVHFDPECMPVCMHAVSVHVHDTNVAVSCGWEISPTQSCFSVGTCIGVWAEICVVVFLAHRSTICHHVWAAGRPLSKSGGLHASRCSQNARSSPASSELNVDASPAHRKPTGRVAPLMPHLSEDQLGRAHTSNSALPEVPAARRRLVPSAVHGRSQAAGQASPRSPPCLSHEQHTAERVYLRLEAWLRLQLWRTEVTPVHIVWPSNSPVDLTQHIAESSWRSAASSAIAASRVGTAAIPLRRRPAEVAGVTDRQQRRRPRRLRGDVTRRGRAETGAYSQAQCPDTPGKHSATVGVTV